MFKQAMSSILASAHNSKQTKRIYLVAFTTIAITACTGNIAYRTQYDLCEIAQSEKKCDNASLQFYKNPEKAEESYTLGFVEFDDQGQLYDRKQMNILIKHLYSMASTDDLLMSVFVHGWHHNAKANDSNIVNYRNTLLKLSRLEQFDAKQAQRKPRKIVGIYVGWRGESVTIPYLNTLTFWDRKSTAQKVGHGGVTEFFSRLEEIRNVKESTYTDNKEIQNRLVIIGHSFGGAVVYSALSQILMDRFVDTKGPVGTASTVKGFGDLVILINPAFEALQIATLNDMANERGSYFSDQAPVLAVLTSEADLATKYAFWAGRVFSTAPAKHRNVTRINKASKQEQLIKQGSADRTAIGHFKPYITHRLNPDKAPQTGNMLQALTDVRNSWQQDKPGQVIHFPGSVLEHRNTTVARNPYLLIQVDKDIIPGHNEIYDERVVSFLSFLIMLSTSDMATAVQ